jgi:hypothetical protein
VLQKKKKRKKETWPHTEAAGKGRERFGGTFQSTWAFFFDRTPKLHQWIFQVKYNVECETLSANFAHSVSLNPSLALSVDF